LVQHPTGISVVLAFGGREKLDQFGVSSNWVEIKFIELRAGYGSALPDLLQQLLSVGSGQE